MDKPSPNRQYRVHFDELVRLSTVVVATSPQEAAVRADEVMDRRQKLAGSTAEWEEETHGAVVDPLYVDGQTLYDQSVRLEATTDGGFAPATEIGCATIYQLRARVRALEAFVSHLARLTTSDETMEEPSGEDTVLCLDALIDKARGLLPVAAPSPAEPTL